MASGLNHGGERSNVPVLKEEAWIHSDAVSARKKLSARTLAKFRLIEQDLLDEI